MEPKTPKKDQVMILSPAVSAVSGNDNLVWEILAYLPSRSVLRFRAVCKRWLSLMSSPGFIADHTRRCRRRPSCLFLVINEQTHSAFSIDGPSAALLPCPSLSFIKRQSSDLSSQMDEDDPSFDLSGITIQNERRLHLWGCDNGLVFCTIIDMAILKLPSRLSAGGIFRRITRSRPPRWYVANPTTMECKEIPSPGIFNIIGAGLLFDPSSSPYYRVVCFGGFGIQTEVQYRFGTFSSKTETWHFSDMLFRNTYLLDRKGISWNGTVNWVTRRWPDGVLSFNPDSQQLHKVSLPPLPHGTYRNVLYFGESGGRLLLVENHNSRPSNNELQINFHIMEMARDRSGWSLLYHVDLGGMVDLFPDVYVKRKLAGGHQTVELLQLCPVHLLLGEEAGEEDVLLLSIPEKFISYNLISKTFRVVCTVPSAGTSDLPRAINPLRVTPYTHILCSP